MTRASVNCDVAVVGAGPAGLAAGILFARRGLRVVVCEKKQFPIDKACGEGIMPWATPLLGALGLKRFLKSEFTHPFRGIRLIGPNHSHFEAPFQGNMGLAVRRVALSEALLRLSGKCPSLELCENTTAHSYERRVDSVALETSRGQINARLLIGADGLRSRVRQWAGLAGPPSTKQRYGSTQHFEIAPWSPFVEIHFKNNVEAYITPCGPSLLGIAFLWNKARLTPRGTDDERLRFFLSLFPEIENRLGSAHLAGPLQSIGPFMQPTTGAATDGVALVGDAAGYADPITGEGIGMGLLQAHLLAECLRSFPKGVVSVEQLRPYAAHVEGLKRYHIRHAWTLLACFESPWVLKGTSRLATMAPGVFRALTRGIARGPGY